MIMESVLEKKWKFDDTIYAFIGIFLLFRYFSALDSGENLFIVGQFLLTGFASFFFLIKQKGGFITFEKLIAVFFLFFLSMAPLEQYSAKTTFWDLPFPSDEYIVLANILIHLLLAILIAFFSTPLLKITPHHSNYNFRFSKRGILILATIDVLVLCFLAYNKILFSIEESTISFSSSNEANIFKNTIKSLPLVFSCLYFSLKNCNLINCNKRSLNIFTVLFLVLFVIGCNPFSGLSRYLLFASYIIIFSLLLSPLKIKHSSYFLLLIFVVIYFIFPSLNFFKYNTAENISSFHIVIADFTSNDYDSFFMISKSLQYYKESGPLFFMNLLTGLFAFIPRSFWSEKLYPSGQLVTEFFNASYTNVSCPIVAELLISSGPIFFFPLSVLFAAILKWLSQIDLQHPVYGIGIKYASLGFLIPILRGAFLPMMSYYYQICFSFLIITFFAFSFLSKKKPRKTKITHCRLINS
jgi:hypothetical protein